MTIDLPATAVGAAVQVMAVGSGDAEPVTVSLTLGGVSVLPPSPVGLRATRQASGGATIRWRRRSRAGWRWIDGSDIALGEEREAYRILVTAAGGTVRAIEMMVPSVDLSLAELGPGIATIEVRQIGTNGLSPAATITI